MTAEEFLSEAARQNLVPGEVLESLRRQVAKSAKPVAPQTLAKLLVDKGHLTAVQSQRLLGTVPAAAAPTKKAAPAALEPLGPIDDLGLAPLEDLLAPLPPEPAAAPSKSAAAPAKPAAKPAAPAKAAPANPPAAKAKAPAPVQELQPLDDLEPLGDLQPIGEAAPLDLSSSGDLFGDPGPAGGFSAAGADPFAPASTAATAAVADPFAQPVAQAPAAAAPTAAPAQPAKKSSGIVGLVIGLVLVLLIAGGTAAAFFLIPRETGEKDFAAAEQDYQAKQLAAAIEKYDAALAKYPASPHAGLAKVHHALAKIQTASSSPTDWPKILPVAKEVLPPIAAQPELTQIHEQLAPLLMDMADGLTTLAAKAKSADDAAALVGQAKEALALTSDARFVPGSLRQWQRLASAEETLAVLEYSARRPNALEAALSKISQTAGSDPASAYAERARLLLEYPDLATSPALQGAMQQVAQAEARNVKPLAHTSAAETTDDQPPIVSGQASAATARASIALANGSALAFDGPTGNLLWRRPARGEALAPVAVSAEAGSDVLLVDDAQLLRIKSATGALAWRRSFSSPLAGGPVVSGAKVLVATRGGQVFRLDAVSGAIDAAVQLPLACRVPPAISADGSRVYQLAEHSLLFSLAAADLACDTAICIGHEPASVVTPPLPIGQFLVVDDNAGAADAVLQVIGLKEDGQPQGVVQRVSIPGHVLTPPVLLGKHLVALTDRGSEVALRITAEKSTPLELLAEPHADHDSGTVLFGLAVGEKLLVAGNGLRLEALDAGSGNFTPTWTAFANEILLAPPQLAGDVLYCVRRDSANAGMVAAAVQASTGKPLWQTPVAADSTPPQATPPQAPPPQEGAANP